ncbi:hypothetical protein D3C78_970850 [compost metagenome]
MGEYYWDEKIDYLMNTRNLYYNDDYFEFLVKSVWKITNPVRVIDFGCGYGYLGLKLLPLLPEGSTYTGVDLGEKLLRKAEEIYKDLPYQVEFIQCDVNEYRSDDTYDIAICHALLLHMSDPIRTLTNMISNISNQGRIICFEPHWIANMANFNLFDTPQSSIVRLGLLQKLFEMDQAKSGRDGNIGIKIPSYLSQLGLKNIECRLSDKVVFLDSNIAEEKRKKLFGSLVEDGIGSNPGDREEFIRGLVIRGMSSKEAEEEYEAELEIYKHFSINSMFTGSFNMKITTGIVVK